MCLVFFFKKKKSDECDSFPTPSGSNRMYLIALVRSTEWKRDWTLLCLCSKLDPVFLRETIENILKDSVEKKRNFKETIELQIGLKNYDPQKDKRFNGTIKLPFVPRDSLKVTSQD